MVDRRQAIGAQTTVVFSLIILVAIVTITRWTNSSMITGSFPKKSILLGTSQTYSSEFDCSRNCSDISPLVNISTGNNVPSESCPEYFKWIHEDLRPWEVTGITKEMIEKAKKKAHLNLVIVDGRVYIEKFKKAYHTRDAVTIWGILQLLRMYPGKLPDVDLMFECGDRPVIKKHDYGRSKALKPPTPMFHYSGDDSSFDIVFPDWSFWGWPELNILPWEILKEDLEEANSRIKWSDREPYAYWKGNPRLGLARRDLVKCNASDWNTRIDKVDWGHETKHGFKTADLASQCTHRYKIYVEGVSWSVSEKYILACDSMSLIINPHYYDFFTRSLLPTIHYWPINEQSKCESIKFAVEWGNKHMNKAQEIGKAGSKYVQEQLIMKYVYDYMFHLLNEYSKLLKYKPSVPLRAIEVCSETMVCSVEGSIKKFRINSMVKDPVNSSPCTMPSPYYPAELEDFLGRKQNLTQQVRTLEESGNLELQP
ncbi:protein O-glucosyltransferase 1-like [Olea europaea var. sylvestris]|uniref:protein O-glucosyltransferase 1-like n=1 Tax=Olea europaea var. sylvestris TaxID=158386 RepID=UPI000C1D230A|nr:protein O-glucosyltransferase 1-like [Olea europaea var. sylvestris]XP_022896353.1 protein O-glucosyltransferase 1-like [Olea europaea var. sylvestris]XP_022896354.1 protein O-glucosyltransferase 1-like [Olea europaea var. sylvestris]